MLKILIVEDELIIAEDVKNMLQKMNYEVVGIAIDHNEVVKLIEQNQPDLILLDINLNCSINGIEIGHMINSKYHIPFIYTTSYSDSSTIERAKITNPINYLVKPFKEEQLFTTIEMALDKFSISNSFENKENTLMIKNTLFIKNKNGYIKINVKDIFWIKSEGNYLEIIYVSNKKELIRATLNGIIDNLDGNFIQIHKSYIINLTHITSIQNNTVTISNTEIPISKTYRVAFFKKLNII